MGTTLPDGVKDLIDGHTFATFATLNEDGSPQASTMWITRDDDDLLMSITKSRQKYRNLVRDARVSVVVPREDPQQGYAEVRGKAELSDDDGLELVNRLFNKYIGPGEYSFDPPGEERIVVRVSPEHVVWRQQ